MSTNILAIGSSIKTFQYNAGLQPSQQYLQYSGYISTLEHLRGENFGKIFVLRDLCVDLIFMNFLTWKPLYTRNPEYTTIISLLYECLDNVKQRSSLFYFPMSSPRRTKSSKCNF